MNSILETITGWFGRRPLPSPPSPPDSAPRIFLYDDDLNWNSMDAIKKALARKGSPASIVAYRIDLQGAVLDGRHLKHPKDRQDENSPGINLRTRGVTLLNGWVSDIPGGIKVHTEDCRFSWLEFLKIGEDALSTIGREASGIRITNSKFWGDSTGDKLIQLNQAKDAVLGNLTLVGNETALRIQKGDYKTPQVIVMGNNIKFLGNATGMNIDGGAIVRLGSPTFTNVKKKWVFGDKGGGKVVVS